jgi:hypothetical protein
MGGGPEVKKKRLKHSPHLSKVSKPNAREITLEEENKLLSDDTISTTRPFTIY